MFAYVPKVTSIFRTPANVEIHQRRNDIIAYTYLPAKEQMAQRIAALRPAIELAACESGVARRRSTRTPSAR